MTRMQVALPAVIALGSNQGDRERLLRDAVRAIHELDGVRVMAASGIVETPALKLDGVDESAPSYLNAVIIAMVSLQPEELLRQLHVIEANFGRVRDIVWGDRTIDLDLIDFAGLVRHGDTLTIPHPRAWQRGFVLAPWLQLHPDAVLTGGRPGAPENADARSEAHDNAAGSAAHNADAASAAHGNAATGNAVSGNTDPRDPSETNRVADLLAATTDRVTVYPAPPLMEVLNR